jgi:hypothetical protein
MMQTKLIVFTLILLALNVGCKSGKFGKKKKAQQLEEITSATGAKAEAERFTFDYLSLRAKAYYKEGNTSQNFTMNVRMKADSVVWISVTGLGFEVARALFLPDSIFIVDRFNKKFYAYDYLYAKKILQTEINLHQLQQILVGNAPYVLDKYQEKNSELKGAFLGYSIDKMMSEIVLNNLLRPSESELKSLIEARTLTVNYTNHQKVDKKWYPHQVDVKVITENSKPELSLSISDVNNNTIDEFPFNIPEKYSKGN